MGLAASQVHFLALTKRKNTVEYNMSVANMHKLSLTREMTDLSQEYSRRLKCKKIAYYNNGDYHSLTYSYLMGYGQDPSAIMSGTAPLKKENSMVLTDYRGMVIMSNEYASVIKDVVGAGAVDKKGMGQTFSTSHIPAIIAQIVKGYSEEQISDAINNVLSSSYSTTGQNLMTGQSGSSGNKDNSDYVTENILKLVDFYYPIFAAAASNGWTTEYNNQVFDKQNNEDYISDALISGTFQLMMVEPAGDYEEDTSLNFFTSAGYIETTTDADTREEIIAWYESEKARIAYKEDMIDLQISDWSTELEAIKTEMQALQSFIDDATSNMSWGSSG